MEVNPLSIILVKSDSKGDRLLFRYPYQHDYQHQHQSNRRNHHNHHRGSPGSALNGHHHNTSNGSQRPRNPYAIGSGGGGYGGGAGNAAGDDPLQSTPPQTSNIEAGQLCGFTDEVLSTLFAVKPELCNRKFELKVNDVRFVAHPTLMQANQPAPETGPDSTTISATGAADSANSAAPNAATAASAATAGSAASAAATASVPGSSILINIVFALHAQASYSIVKCYYELSKRLGHALVYEEQRVGYLSAEMAAMVKSHDEIAGVMAHSGSSGGGVGPNANNSSGGGSGAAKTGGTGGGGGDLNGSGGGGGDRESGSGTASGDGAAGAGNTECGVVGGRSQQPSAFDLILERCTLAQCLKNIYHDLCTTGLLNITINQWVTLSFCLPQKAHQFHKRGVVVEPEAIDRCLQSLKPYHGMLLLVDLAELLDCFPPSGARMLLQLLNAYNPLKTLQNMASEADLDIKHVYELVGHLVYWAKATIIYPLCETNVYVIAPDAPLHSHSPLVEKFSGKFPGMSLFEVISDFSLPTSIGHLTTPLQHPTRQGTLAQMVLWMLQHHLLMQLHTYVQFMPTEHGECSSPSVSCSEEDAVCGGGGAEQKSPETDGRDDDDDANLLSQLTISSSQPMAVPNTSRRSLTDDPSTTTSDDAADDVGDTDDNTGASNHLLLLQRPPPQQPGAVEQQSPPSSPAETTTETTESESLAGSVEDEDKIRDLLMVFREPERSAVRDLSAASNAEDLALMVKLWQAGYFKGEHHLEEIMYFENLRRSQLLQLLDKFRDVLIIYETEDPAIATLYTQTADC